MNIQNIEIYNELFDRWARLSGMPLCTSETHLLMKFLPSQGTQVAYDAALRYLSNPQHHFLTFVGEPGRGKTHLALGIGWQWISQSKGWVQYWQAERFLDQIREEYNMPRDANINTFEYAQRCSLFILDDLGAEKATEWALAKMDELIDHRYLNQLSTVFTTNLHPNQLPPRIESRLREGVVVTLKGIDYRKFNSRLKS